MSRSIGLAAYVLKLRSREDGSHARLSRIDPLTGAANIDFMTLWHNYCTLRTRHRWHDEESQRVLRVDQEQQSGRSSYGIVEAGDHGIETDLVEVDSQTLAHHRSVDEAELHPYFFLLKVPSAGDRAFLVLQSGVKDVLAQDLITFVHERLIAYRLDIGRVVPEEQYQRYANEGRPYAIRFIRRGIKPDIADALGIPLDLTQTGEMEMVIRVDKRQTLTGRVQDWLRGQGGTGRFVEVPDFPDYDSVKVVVNVSGRQRTLDLNDPRNIKSAFDVTDRVALGRDGHPIFDEMLAAANELIEDIINPPLIS